MDLKTFFTAHPETAVALSGGVDSAVLLAAAAKWGRRVRAYTVRSQFQPAFEQQDAVQLAAQLGAPLTVLEVDVLRFPQVCENPPDRCYHCKRAIFSAIWDAARQDGFSVLLEGTNASDDAADRPGMRALQELGVLSPLRLCGLGKPEVRALAKEAGLPVWDKPAYACLATRMLQGEPITAEKLSKVEQAEGFLFSLGFTDFRVRTQGGQARLQLRKEQLSLLLARREAVLERLKPLFSAVLLDLEVRK